MNETTQRNEVLTDAVSGMDLKNMMLNEISQIQRDKYHDSIHVKYLAQANAQKQREEGRFPAAAARKEWGVTDEWGRTFCSG